jgi:hypothetical protein
MTKTYEDYMAERRIRLKELSKWSKEQLLNFVNRNYRVHGLTIKSSKEDLKYAALDVTNSIPRHVSKKQTELEQEMEAAARDAAEMAHLLNY